MFAICSPSFRPGHGPTRSPWASAAASSTDPVQKKAVPLTDGPLRLLRVFHVCGQRPSKGGSHRVKNLINYASGYQVESPPAILADFTSFANLIIWIPRMG